MLLHIFLQYTSVGNESNVPLWYILIGNGFTKPCAVAAIFMSFIMPRHFLLCPATKSGGVLCYTLRTFECLSFRLSVYPSAVDHLCPLHNFDTVRDNFMKLVTNIKHDQTRCRD